MSGKPNRHSKEDYEACAAEGLTQAQTAKRLGVKPGTVNKCAARHGITFRSSAQAGYKVSRVDYVACAELGMSVSEAAHKLGVHVDSVREYAHRHGLTFAKKAPLRRKNQTAQQRREALMDSPKRGFVVNGKKKKAWLRAETENPGATAKFIAQLSGASESSVCNWRWEQQYPERRAAHKAVQQAIASGFMFRKPCQECGAPKTHAHHTDYSRPLVVQWLCADCHREAHNG